MLYYKGCVAIWARYYAWLLADARIPELEDVSEEDVDSEEDSEDEGEVASAAPAESAAERAVRERERGNGLFRAGQLEAALDAYELSIAAEPTASAHANAALVLLRMRRAEEAVTQADAGLGLEPGHVKALHRRACARRMLGLSLIHI